MYILQLNCVCTVTFEH